jgi:hypothetical protein
VIIDLEGERFARAPRLTSRHAGGAYGWLTPHIAEMAASAPSISSRALSLPRDELHFIGLVIALASAPVDLAALARAIGREPRATILASFAPACDARLARLVPKITGRPWRAPTYRRLAMLYAEPHARKVLSHLRAITRRVVLTLWRLPAPYRTRGVLAMIERPRDLSRVLFAIEIVRRVRTDLTDRQIIASLDRADSGYIRDWVEAHYERLPFPAAPTAALSDGRGGVLRPVTTGEELIRWAREFDNCAANRLWRGLTGDTALYRYDVGDRPTAFVELRPVPGVGWAIEEAVGRANAPLAPEDRTALFNTFADAGVPAAPQAYGRGWFDLD